MSPGDLSCQVKSAAEATDTAEMVVQVRVRSPKGDERIINLCDTEEQFKSITVLQLKEKIAPVFGCQDENLQLIFGAEFLEEGALLSSYRIRHFSAIHTVVKLPGGGGDPGKGDGGMGDKEGKNRMHTLAIGFWPLEDDELLTDHGIKDGSTIELNGGVYHCGRISSGMGDREGRNQSMECVAIMLTGSDVSSESAPHPQPAAVEDLHQD